MRWLQNGDLVVNPDEDVHEKWIIFHQVGWRGQTGRLYTMDENPALTEPGSFSPMYIQITPE